MLFSTAQGVPHPHTTMAGIDSISFRTMEIRLEDLKNIKD